MDDRLDASASLAGDEARTLAAALNGAAPGRQADPPLECPSYSQPDSHVMLLVRAKDSVRTVWASFGACARYRLDNGVRDARLTMSILRLVMSPLHLGYGVGVGLPAD